MRKELGELLTAIDHVGIAVADLDAAIEFHEKTFGLVVAHSEENEDQGVREAMLRPSGSGQGDAQIQLLAPLREDAAIAKFLDRNGQGMQQLAYRVEDIDAVSATLRERGVTLLYDAPKIGTGGSRIQFAHPKSTGGILLEIVEPPAAAAH